MNIGHADIERGRAEFLFGLLRLFLGVGVVAGGGGDVREEGGEGDILADAIQFAVEVGLAGRVMVGHGDADAVVEGEGLGQFGCGAVREVRGEGVGLIAAGAGGFEAGATGGQSEQGEAEQERAEDGAGAHGYSSQAFKSMSFRAARASA
jgi:hypothetical protein